MAPTEIGVANGLIRATWSGRLPGGEIFSHGQYLYTAIGAGINYAAIGANLSSYITNLLTTSAGTGITMAGVFASTTIWDRLTIQGVAESDGSPVGDPLYIALTDHGTGGVALPNQISHCVTIRADPFGASNRNRFYLPPYVAGLAGSSQPVAAGVVNNNIQTAVAGWQHAEWTSLAATTPEIFPAVYSPAKHKAYQATDCYLGNILDTQRRRRNKEVEVRTITTLP